MTDRVLYANGAYSVLHVPIDVEGRATRIASATYRIDDIRRADTDPEREIVANTTANVDSASTSTSAAAGPGQGDAKLIAVNATTGFVEGHRYLISQAGQRQLFVLERIGTLALYATHDLRLDFTSGASVQGIELTAVFPSGEAADEAGLEEGGGPYRVLWTYTINGRSYIVPREVWLSRHSVQPVVSEIDVLQAWPTLASRARTRVPLTQAIAFATLEFQQQLRSAGKDPAYFLSSESARLAVIYRSVANVARMYHTEQDLEIATKYDERYEQVLRSLVTGIADFGTVQINPATDQASDRGTSRIYGDHLVRRS